MTDPDERTTARSRPMRRIGELLPAAARELGLEDELIRARALATWEAIVAERVPAATGASRLTAIHGSTLVIEADAPIVAQELTLHGPELVAAFAAAPGGRPARDLRVGVRRV